ncbi:MAG: energy transducer TonB [Rhodospirillaceae bacterium]|nr:energy transducer TonB [Rhodospirillaceae bacterium]
MKVGATVSATLHVAVFAIAIYGLPHWRSDPPLPDKLMVIDVVEIASQTNAPPRPEPVKKTEPKPAPKKPKPAKVDPPPPPPPPPPKKQAAAPKPEPAPKPIKPKAPEPKPEPVAAPAPKPKPKAKPKPKLEPKKAAAPKIAPKPMPRPKVKPKRKTAPKQDFAKLLKSVEKLKKQPPPTIKEKTPAKKKPEDAAKRLLASAQQAVKAISNKQFDPNARLSISEIDAVRRQISQCWNIPAGAKDAQDLVVDIQVEMNPDASVRSAKVVDGARMNGDQFFRTAAESAMRAVLNPRCNPLRLPLDKYQTWKNFTIGFNPRDVLE